MDGNVFDSPNVDGLSQILPFRTAGAGSPLFCFPGSGGNPHIFREMVAALPEGQRVYAVDMEWLCEANQEFTVETLAPFYLDMIRRIQGNGPYYLCGYSFGGLVVYEIARLLIERGTKANLVALLDAPNPALLSNLSHSDSVQFHKTYLVDRLKRYGLKLMQGDMKAFTSRALAFVVSRLGGFFMPAIKRGFRMLKRPVPKKLRANDPGFLRAWRSYSPQHYAGSLVLFRVQDRGPEYDGDPSMGWSSSASEGVQVHVVPGTHVHMMTMPSVGFIAAKLATYLDNGSNQHRQNASKHSEERSGE
jgi:thioesterase domain-containing protein